MKVLLLLNAVLNRNLLPCDSSIVDYGEKELEKIGDMYGKDVKVNFSHPLLIWTE